MEKILGGLMLNKKQKREIEGNRIRNKQNQAKREQEIKNKVK